MLCKGGRAEYMNMIEGKGRGSATLDLVTGSLTNDRIR